MKRRRTLLYSITVVLALCAACGLWLHRERRQYASNRQLIAALEHDDAKQALALVNAGADPNTREEPPPLPSLERLLHQLLRHTPPAHSSPTAFMLACRAQVHSLNGVSGLRDNWDENLPLFQSMLAQGADVQAKALDNSTALHYAVAGLRGHTMEWLLQHGAEVNATDRGGITPLMLSANHADTSMASLLLAQGANPNAQDKYGQTALYFAINSPTTESLLPLLLAHGANPNIAKPGGRSLLQWAKQAKRADLVHLLKQHGAK